MSSSISTVWHLNILTPNKVESDYNNLRSTSGDDRLRGRRGKGRERKEKPLFPSPFGDGDDSMWLSPSLSLVN